MNATPGPQILVVEDEPNIRELVSLHLRLEHAVPLRPKMAARDRTGAAEAFDLVILDLICRSRWPHGLSRDSQGLPEKSTPILMLTARVKRTTRSSGSIRVQTTIGETLCVRELMARVRALSAVRSAVSPASPQASARIVYRDIEIDPARRRVRVGTRDVDLTANEFQLLSVLLASPGIVFSREALLGRVWNNETFVTVRSVDTLIKRVRKKIESDPAEPDVILTVWGTG